MRYEKYLEYALLSLVIYFIFFLRLDSSFMRPWDESYYAINAYEMGKAGNFLVPQFDGRPDFFNLKPPMEIWAEMIFIKVFGLNELTARLPSAICGALTSVLLFIFLKKNFNRIWAWSSFFVLVTSNGFVNFHTARTGEMDAMLTLFLFLNTIYLFHFVAGEKPDNKTVFLYWVFLTFAFLTKSFASLLFIPSHIALLFAFKKIRPLVTTPALFAGIVLLVTTALGFFFLREQQQPGYLDAVLDLDAGRMGKVVDGHNEPFDFYFNNLFLKRFSTWIGLFIIGTAFLFFKEKDKKIQVICNISIFSALIYLILVSLSATKLEWYDMPLYPFLAIVTGYGCSRIFDTLPFSDFSYTKQMGIILLIFSIPTYYAIKNSHDQSLPVAEKKMQRITEYVYNKEHQGSDLNGWKVIDKWPNGQLLFYKYKLAEKDQHLHFAHENTLIAGDKVFLQDDAAKKIIELKYEFKIIDTFKEVTAYEIIALK